MTLSFREEEHSMGVGKAEGKRYIRGLVFQHQGQPSDNINSSNQATSKANNYSSSSLPIHQLSNQHYQPANHLPLFTNPFKTQHIKMYTQIIIASFLALAATSICAPVDANVPAMREIAPATDALVKRRDECTVNGYKSISQSVSYGIAAAATSNSGDLTIHCTNGKTWDSGDKLSLKSQTIKAADTGLEKDIVWKENWVTGGYKSCEAGYGDGPLIPGKVSDGNIRAGVGISSNSNSCEVTFVL